MGPPSRMNFHRQPPLPMLPPRQRPRPGRLQPSLSIGGSTSVRAGSRETWAIADAILAKKLDKGKEKVGDCSDNMSLLDIARGEVDIISQRLKHLSEEFLEGLKNELRVILEGADGSQHGDEFLILQKLIQKRGDLTANTLTGAHRVQLEILVAINTGMQAFLHPSMSLSQTSLIEVFLFKRCRNIECQSQLPADDCTCKVCANTDGFCNLCMCVSCNKFDFEGNTCRWIGCDLCSHWTHTDCAIRDVLICMGPSVKSGAGAGEMLFRCRACNRTSELLGWVKDVFQHCAPAWDREALMRELDFVSRIFRGSEDTRGRKLFWKCEELIEKMKGGVPESAACRVILMLFQGTYYAKHFDNLSYCIILCGEICYLEKKSLSISLLLFFLIFNGSQFTYH